jgi:hypothetical protein
LGIIIGATVKLFPSCAKLRRRFSASSGVVGSWLAANSEAIRLRRRAAATAETNEAVCQRQRDPRVLMNLEVLGEASSATTQIGCAAAPTLPQDEIRLGIVRKFTNVALIAT